MSAIAFATSTLLLQIVDIPCEFYIPFIVWIVLVIIVAILFKPQHPPKLLSFNTKGNLCAMFKAKQLYPVYLNVMFGIAAKSYY